MKIKLVCGSSCADRATTPAQGSYTRAPEWLGVLHARAQQNAYVACNCKIYTYTQQHAHLARFSDIVNVRNTWRLYKNRKHIRPHGPLGRERSQDGHVRCFRSTGLGSRLPRSRPSEVRCAARHDHERSADFGCRCRVSVSLCGVCHDTTAVDAQTSHRAQVTSLYINV